MPSRSSLLGGDAHYVIGTPVPSVPAFILVLSHVNVPELMCACYNLILAMMFINWDKKVRPWKIVS